MIHLFLILKLFFKAFRTKDDYKIIMTKLIISISGVRGIVGETLGPVAAAEFGLAYGTFLRRDLHIDRPKIIIGRDSRPSGPMLASALVAGLAAAGCDTVDLGIVTTPGVGVMIEHLQADGGVVLTASHNPIEYNGIKFLRHDGIAYPADQIRQVHEIYYGKSFAQVNSGCCGNEQSKQRNP